MATTTSAHPVKACSGCPGDIHSQSLHSSPSTCTHKAAATPLIMGNQFRQFERSLSSDGRRRGARRFCLCWSPPQTNMHACMHVHKHTSMYKSPRNIAQRRTRMLSMAQPDLDLVCCTTLRQKHSQSSTRIPALRNTAEHFNIQDTTTKKNVSRDDAGRTNTRKKSSHKHAVSHSPGSRRGQLAL